MKDSDLFLLGGLAIIGYVLYTKLAPGASQAPLPAQYPVTGTPNTGTAPYIPANNIPGTGASNTSTPGPSNGQTSTNPTGVSQDPNNNPGSNPEGDDNYDSLASAGLNDSTDPNAGSTDNGD